MFIATPYRWQKGSIRLLEV